MIRFVLLALVLAPCPLLAADPLPVELQYVPTDAAGFVHVDFKRLWASPLGQSARTATAPEVARLTAAWKAATGLTLADVETVTAFVTKDDDQRRFGDSFAVIVRTGKPFDRAGVIRTAKALAGKTETVVVKGHVVTVNVFPRNQWRLDLTEPNRLVYSHDCEPAADPKRPDGPLTPLLRAAVKQPLAAGVAFASLSTYFRLLPDAGRGELRPDMAILKSPTALVTGQLAAKELVLTATVRGPNARHAANVETALDLVRRETTAELKTWAADPDRGTMVKPFVEFAVKHLPAVTLTTDGSDATAAVALPTDLPVGKLLDVAFDPVKQDEREARRRLFRIAVALHTYFDKNGFLPPSHHVSKKGKTTFSWRVLLLPHLGEAELFKKFKLDEPWDGDHNAKVLKDNPMPEVFALPGVAKAGATDTHFRVFFGKEAGWDVDGRLKFADFLDGTSNTLALVTAATAVPWTKPDELEFDPEADMRKLLLFRHGRCPIATVDGGTRLLRKAISEETLRYAIMRADGFVLGDDF